MKCLKCKKVFLKEVKKLEKGHSTKTENHCTSCYKKAPRLSMKPIRSIKK